MKTGLRVAWGAMVLALASALAACAQSPAAAHRGAQVLVFSGGLNAASIGRGVQGEPAQGGIMREIDDPNLGDRWLLMRNDDVPGGPGRMVMVAAHRQPMGGAPLRAAKQTAEEARLLPVIRAGDRLTVEEHTARVDAVLEARALSAAAAGSALDARLAIGGRVVRAVALGPGRAVLQPETEARR